MATPAVTWPTTASVRPVLSELIDAADDVDELRAYVAQLVDREEGIPAGVDPPSVVNLGVLAWVIESVALEVETLQQTLEKLEELRSLVAQELRTDA